MDIKSGWEEALGSVSALRSLLENNPASCCGNTPNSAAVIAGGEVGKLGGMGRGRGSSLEFKLRLYLCAFCLRTGDPSPAAPSKEDLFEGEGGTKRCEAEFEEVVEFERVRMPVEVVFMAYGCGFDLMAGEDVFGNGSDVDDGCCGGGGAAAI